MNVLFILVPVALMLAGAGALAFRWAVNDGQYDDLESPSFRMLIDDDDLGKSAQETSGITPTAGTKQ